MWLCDSKSLFIFFVFLFYSINTGECLQCYNCSSQAGGDCDFPLNTITVFAQHCAFTQNRCIIANKTINGVPHIRRSCGHEDYCPGNTRVFSVGCSDCTWDLCNSSYVENFSFTVVVLSTILVNISRLCVFI